MGLTVSCSSVEMHVHGKDLCSHSVVVDRELRLPHHRVPAAGGRVRHGRRLSLQLRLANFVRGTESFDLLTL